MATTLRKDAKHEIINILRKQGYASYARLVELFDIYLTDDPKVIGYMLPDKAKIVLNKELSISQVSTVVRHEILHEYLTHKIRQLNVENEHPELSSNHELANIAADYEISNKGYTKADKINARAIILGDKVLRGLVTEDDYPDWQDKSFEEMYVELLKKRQQNQNALQNLIDKLSGLNNKDLDDLQDELDDTKEDSKASNETKDKADELSDQIDDIKDEISNNQSSGVFDTDEEQQEKKDVATRVAQIKKMFDDIKQKESIIKDTATQVNADRIAQAAKDADRISRSGISRFKLSLNNFISNQIEEMEDETFTRIHPSYEDNEFIKPGKITREEKHIPLINVYWDVSGSFSDERKTKGARDAIATLNTYVRNGDIAIDVYYFATKVAEKAKDAGGGTYGEPVLNHIKQTKPDNVIIITDADISDCGQTVTVPGAVWFLFYDARSENLISHLKGKKETKVYDIEY